MNDPVAVALLIFAASVIGALWHHYRPVSVIGPSSPLWWLRYGINPTSRTSLGYWQISAGEVLPLPEWNARRAAMLGHSNHVHVGRLTLAEGPIERTPELEDRFRRLVAGAVDRSEITLIYSDGTSETFAPKERP